MESKLGSLLRKRREDLRLTLRDVQEKTGISNAYLSQIENGRMVKPAPALLQKLGYLYNIPYPRILELAGHPAAEGSVRVVQFRTGSGTEDLTGDEEKELLDYLRFIRSRKRKP